MSLHGFVVKNIDHNRQSFIALCDKIWDFAELGLVEFKSSEMLATQLESNGFDVKRGISGMSTAFIATCGTAKPIMGIMGEYDALANLYQKRVSWKEPLESDKPGHGCGHNIHGVSGLAAAIAIKICMEEHNIKGTIKFFGCPAEETFSSKVFMVRDGYFDDVDCVISHHPDMINGASLESNLAVNSAKFHFNGKASHAGASPELGRSALDALELMNVGVNYMREHIVQDARIHYVIEKGGGQPNIVPSYARSWYYIRAPERDQVESIYAWIVEIARGAEKMTQTKLRVEFQEGCYNYLPNHIISEVITKKMDEVGLPNYSEEDIKFAQQIAKSITHEMKITQLKKTKRPDWKSLIDVLIDRNIPKPWGKGEISHGSTDVADVSWHTPTVEFSTASWILGTPAHSWQAVAQSGVGLGHKSMIFAAKVMATTIIELLTDKTLLKKAKEEHRDKMENKKYKSPLPLDTKPPIDIWKK